MTNSFKKKPEFKFKENVENRCIDYLRANHVGKENAIPHKLLATRLNINPRKVRALISHLVRVHYIPIGSLSKSDSGIFFIDSKKEMEQCYNELKSRSDKLINRYFALEKAFRKYSENIKNPKLFNI